MAAALVIGALGASGCDPESRPASPGAGDTAAPAATATAAAPAVSAATQSAKAEPKPVCTTLQKKVWAKHANTRTGLTPTRFADGRLALGVAVGVQPHILTFDDKGEGKLTAVKLEEGTELAKRISPKEGARHLQRVTVTAGMKTFADYRDKYESGRRRIACGPTGKDAPFLVYDGEPMLEDVDDSGRDRSTTPEATAPAAGGSADPAGAVPPPAAEKKELRELRDCRTFATADGKDLWATGSELVGYEKDGEVRYKMRFFVLPRAGQADSVTLHEVDLGPKPKKLHTLEAPVAHRLSDGHFVIAGRYQGRMYGWLLSKDKRVQGNLQQYGGGYPSLPRIIDDGETHLLLTSQQVDLTKWKLRALPLRKGSPLLAALQIPKIGDDDDSVAEPTFARVGTQGWLAYHAGERRKGRITVVPVSDELAEMGQEHTVTDESTLAYESYLFARGDKLLVVYLSRPDEKEPSELVSELMTCTVQEQAG